ncbi:MAG: LrgB family protein [Desulfuromonas sp.]|nr:LrgB family protein [Desulfuromonas sp.]
MAASLIETPLFGVTLTLVIYLFASILYRRFQYALLNPVIIAIVFIIALLRQCDIPYQHYAHGGDLILFLLGPAVVALGVPLYQRRDQIIQRLVPIVTGITAGAITSIITSSGLILLLGGSKQLALTLAPKSVTTPIAIGIADKIGGITPLTAASVVITGCLGAMIGPSFCRLLRINHPASMGLAMGTAAHGLGTGRMLEIDHLGGAIAGLAIGLNGIITALLMPLLILLLDQI